METIVSTEKPAARRQHDPWNKGRLIGQKRPLKPKDVWTIRVRLQLEEHKRDLAMFNLAIDSKLRGCDLVRLKIDDVCASGRVRDRPTVIQKKTGRPVQFEITEQTRIAIGEWLAALSARRGRYLFLSRFQKHPHLSTRQYARIVHRWWSAPGSTVRRMGRTRCVERSRLRSTRTPATCGQCSSCSGTQSWSTVRYLGIEVDDALAISEQVEL
jgi:integrase